ncbi:Coatomer subunit beta' [Fasciola gigantica]|uniref:Beta'-coat protein n=1 Tax=Fasciola gigantica TaxID=46835 RepID=A0A504YTL0_FASGI|nr:Coatomer subunit beta' [Fasciola gigantica]
MPLRLDIKRKLLSRSDRVKALDLHPTEPWICAALYNGTVHVWNIETQQLIKTLEVCTTPVRAVKFVARKNWIVTGSDDLQLRVFNYNTFGRLQQIEAHSDYIRSIAVHPTQPFILTSSDDMLIRLWDWEKNWTCAQVFEGHNHYVMQLVFNPKDHNTFASASLDHTVKVWSLGSTTPNFTLEGHERGVNCVDYYLFGDKPYLASGSDDRTVKIWDYQTKACVQTLEGHAQNISAVAFHPELPIIMTGSEDGTVRVWHSSTYRLESTLNYGLERIWAMVCHRGKQLVGIGYDEGTIVISLGRDEPAMSMDASGKLVCARHAELVQANLRSLSLGGADGADEIQDGERLPVSFKEMGTSDIYPQTIEHNANGRFVVVCGDGEYIVYTAMALRNKTFGQAQEFVWSLADASMYAVRESNAIVKVYKQFKETRTFKLDYGAEQIFGGHLLGVRSLTGLTLYDWSTGKLVRRIDISPRAVCWNESGQLVALCTSEVVYVLRYTADQVPDTDPVPGSPEEADGYEQAFQLVKNGEINVAVRNGMWYGDAFLFTTTTNRLCYYVGGELVTLAHLDRPMYLLGYLAKENRLFLGDRDLQIVSYSLLLSVLEYETAVMRGDFTAADAIFPNIPKEQRTKIAQFLEKQGFRTQAMRVTTDPDHKFELALQLGDHELCRQLASEGDPEANEIKWKQLAEAACRASNFSLVEECLCRTKDYASLLLLASSSGNSQLLKWIGEQASTESKDNVAFLARFLLSDLEGCLELLVKAERLPEAAFFARTYLPSKVPEIVELWRTWLDQSTKSSAKIVQALANPKDYPNLFPGLEDSLAAEQWLKVDRKQRTQLPASAYSSQIPMCDRDPITEMRSGPPSVKQIAEVMPQSMDDLLFSSGPATHRTPPPAPANPIQTRSIFEDNAIDHDLKPVAQMVPEVQMTRRKSDDLDTSKLINPVPPAVLAVSALDFTCSSTESQRKTIEDDEEEDADEYEDEDENNNNNDEEDEIDDGEEEDEEEEEEDEGEEKLPDEKAKLAAALERELEQELDSLKLDIPSIPTSSENQPIKKSSPGWDDDEDDEDGGGWE